MKAWTWDMGGWTWQVGDERLEIESWTCDGREMIDELRDGRWEMRWKTHDRWANWHMTHGRYNMMMRASYLIPAQR